MRQYQVPQFITVEDKVFGPLTIIQALYMGAGGIIAFLAYTFFNAYLFWPIAIISLGFCGALAFLKINEQPFSKIVKNGIGYMLRPRLYLWKKETALPPSATGAAPEQKPETAINAIPKITESKLSDLAWSLDIKHDQGPEQ